MIVTHVSDYDVLISMDDLARFGADMRCRQSTIYFPVYKFRIYWNGKSTQARSPMAKCQERPDFPSLLPEAFVKQYLMNYLQYTLYYTELSYWSQPKTLKHLSSNSPMAY